MGPFVVLARKKGDQGDERKNADLNHHDKLKCTEFNHLLVC